jgi:hypothetical protein
MKNTLTIIISGLILCGCSQKQATPSARAIDLVLAGTNEVWIQSDNKESILNITKRDGNSLEGIQITGTTPDGHKSTCTADTATLVSGSVENPADEHSVRIIVHNPHVNNGGPMVSKIAVDVTFVFHK